MEMVPRWVPFKDSFDFSVAEPFGCAPLDVGLRWLIELHADFGDYVKGHVQLPVAALVEPMPDRVS